MSEQAKQLADASRMLDDAAQRLYVLEDENERLRNESARMIQALGRIAEPVKQRGDGIVDSSEAFMRAAIAREILEG